MSDAFAAQCDLCGTWFDGEHDDECARILAKQRDMLAKVAALALTGKRGVWYPKGLRDAAAKSIGALPARVRP